jgi:RNA polymerase sigma-70 factor (ECF subfamily)
VAKPSPADVIRGEGAVLSEEALSALFEDLRPRLGRFARQRGLGGAAEDAVQDTLLAALKGFREHKFDGQSSIKAWIFGILRHKVADHRRADTRELAHLSPLVDETDNSEHTTAPRATNSHPELTILVNEVLQTLPARHWLVLMLNKRVGLKTREIAPLLRLSPGRTGAILAEAQEMFRRGISSTEETSPRRRLLK